MRDTNMKILTCIIPKEIHHRFKMVATARNTTMTKLIIRSMVATIKRTPGYKKASKKPTT